VCSVSQISLSMESHGQLEHKAHPEAGSGIFRFVAFQRVLHRLFPRQRSVNLVVSRAERTSIALLSCNSLGSACSVIKNSFLVRVFLAPCSPSREKSAHLKGERSRLTRPKGRSLSRLIRTWHCQTPDVSIRFIYGGR
jgi:hypothetical protein